MFKKIISVLLSMIITMSCSLSLVSYAKEEATSKSTTTENATADLSADENISTTEDTQQAQKTLEEQQAEIEKNLIEIEKKLKELEKDSKNTVEYIDALDSKIININKQLSNLEKSNIKIKEEMKQLQAEIDENEKALTALQKEIDDVQAEIDKLEELYNSIYEAYCVRMRVMYIGGSFNFLTAILTSDDVSSMFTRYQMIKSISKTDAQLLDTVKNKANEIKVKKDGLNEKAEEYKKLKSNLSSKKLQLDSKKKAIERNTERIAKQKAILATDKAESDMLLAKLNAQNKQYSEFRTEDEELLKKVEDEIQGLISGLIAPDEITTVSSSSNIKENDIVIKDSEVYSKSDGVYNLLYPVPRHYSVSAGFPNYSSGRYHGGVDFPCGSGTSIVAAQKGIVITSKKLNYSYGRYIMIYHGTDSMGRSVVTLYAHNNKLLVSNGDTVKRGQVIAYAGSTGNSTGPHCHFELRVNGKRSNPTYYFNKK